ncbi:serine/threonine protein kinase [Kocuria marina]|uniref:serine/threonine protein kinase n=1 Tax=Kocuria marina TaxID=223184 RepID=UPI0019D2DE57|nr:protein kinase [Kocuria indica]MBN6811214.1 protein kinase [Kocuria indica]MBN6842889.1 protein kinase [Kocuria indica]
MNAEQEPEQLEAPSRTRDASAPSRGHSARDRVRAVRAGERRRHGREGYDDAAAAPGAAPSASAVSAGHSVPAHRVQPADRAESPESMSDPAAETVERDGLELVEKLGEGGGSRTWLARERTTHEKYTVTFVVTEDREHRRAGEEQIAALVEAWAESPHPELVSVRATLGGDGASRALVADHVRGKTLEDTMRDRGRLRPEDTAPVLAAVARVLSHLHERGWVHGDLAAHHVLLTPDGRALVDGYGVPAGSSVGPVPWGVADRSAHPGVALGPAEDAYTAVQDVHALGVLGWLALTGRHPGPESHRVPLTLMCPAAPRHLVLMLEAALADDPAARPSAQELAAGFSASAPRSKPVGRPPERMTPEVIRADGTVVRPRRLMPLRTVPRRLVPPRRIRMSPGGVAVAGVDTSVRHRAWLAAAGVLGAAALAWGFLAWDGGGPVARPAESGATSAAEAGTASSPPDAAAGTPSGTSSQSPGATPVPDAAGASREATERSATAPGETMQDKDGEARRAVEGLVSARAAALAAGDETAVAEVYVADSGLAARDRDLIRRAKAQDTSGSGFTALSSVSMDVARLTEQRPRAGSGLTPAEAARTRTYDAEVRTRGWHGELPTGSHVTRQGDEALQTLRISVTHTPQGWRLADVTPVEAAP